MPPRQRTPKPCVFCAIVAGDLAADFVAKESGLVAFLDSHPLFLGHVLVVPTRHVETLKDLPAGEVGDFFRVVQRLERAVEMATESDGSMVLNNNVVSQSVPHLHVHVIPRRRGDGLRLWLGPRRRYAAGESAGYAERIAAAYVAAE